MQTSFQFGAYEMENKRRQHPRLWEKRYNYLRDELQSTTNVVLAARMIGIIEYKVLLA